MAPVRSSRCGQTTPENQLPLLSGSKPLPNQNGKTLLQSIAKLAAASNEDAYKKRHAHGKRDSEFRAGSMELDGTGVATVYMLGVKAQMPHIRRNSFELDGNVRWDSLQEFRAAYDQQPDILKQLQNKVKVCPSCKKACAFNQEACNSCGASLMEVDMSFTDNLLMSFVYGIAKGNFPYKVSIRSCNERYLCFDDPLCVSVCHLNIVPTSVHVPDLRYLFKDPARGRALVQGMLEEVSTACLDNFWNDESFRTTYFNGDMPPESLDALSELGASGMNFPPSQYQLHLQYIHGPLLPFHYALFVDGSHFQYMRFFPVDYILAALSLGDSMKMDVQEHMAIGEIVDRAAALGVSYDLYWGRTKRRIQEMQAKFSPWRDEHFAYRVVGTKAFDTQTGLHKADADIKKLQANDVKAIQSYGRPYGPDDKPTGSYYPFARLPEEVESWC